MSLQDGKRLPADATFPRSDREEAQLALSRLQDSLHRARKVADCGPDRHKEKLSYAKAGDPKSTRTSAYTTRVKLIFDLSSYQTAPELRGGRL